MFSLSALRPICRGLPWRSVQAGRSGLLESVRPGRIRALQMGAEKLTEGEASVDSERLLW